MTSRRDDPPTARAWIRTARRLGPRLLVGGLLLAGILPPGSPGARLAAAAPQSPYGGLASPFALPPAPLPPIVATCTPRTVQVGFEPAKTVRNPIAHALGMAGPGSVIRLGSGVYPGFSIGQASSSDSNARTAGGLPGRPVIVEGVGAVRIRADGSDAILVAQQVRNGHFLFRNLTLQPGWRSAVLFARGGVHEGFEFQDVDILGGFDHATGQGRGAKWGVHGQGLKDFAFRGVTREARVVNLRDEHAFYLQNLQGDVTIERVVGANLGRTFVQITARSNEGSPGIGTVTIRDCKVRDCGLAPGDGYKGGSAFTFSGRHRGVIVVERCSYRAGTNPALLHRHAAGEPYGTGALVATAGGEAEPLRRLVLRDNDFVFASRCGDRPVVQLEAATEVELAGRNRFFAGHYGVALRIGRGESLDLSAPGPGRLVVSPFTEVRGRVERHGREVPLTSLR